MLLDEMLKLEISKIVFYFSVILTPFGGEIWCLLEGGWREGTLFGLGWFGLHGHMESRKTKKKDKKMWVWGVSG